MRLNTYQLVVASIVYSENDKRVGCRPYQLLEHLRFATGQDDEQHNAVVNHIEHTKKYALELRLSCETNSTFIVVVQNERRDEKHFFNEQCLEANPPENYIIDIGDSKSRTLTIYRVEEEGHSTKGEKGGREREDSQSESLYEHKIPNKSSFLKRLWRNRAGSTHQIVLSSCNINDWHQNSISSGAQNSIITFRILPKPDLDLDKTKLSSCDATYQDFFDLTKAILEADAELSCESSSFGSREYAGDVADVGDAILDHTFSFCFLTTLTKRILVLAALLDWSHPRIPLSSRAIPYAITQLQACSFTTTALCRNPCQILSHYAIEYTRKRMQSCQSTCLFPPICSNPLHFFNKSIEGALFLCELEIWQHFYHLSPIQSLRQELCAMIERDVTNWISQCDEDLTLAALSFSTAMYQFSKEYIVYFDRFGVSYCAVVFNTLDQKLTECGQATVKKMLKQLDSHDDEQLEMFTKVTMKLFEAYKNLARFAKDAQLEKLSFFSYEKWFEDCTTFWTYTWRILCRRYTLRALEEDIKSCDEKVLPSSVNFLAIHKALCEDFVHLELTFPTTLLMCVLKIALITADDLIIYAKRMQTTSKQFEESKILLAANSIEHAKTFALKRPRELLNFSTLLTQMPHAEATQANISFQLIINSAVQQCEKLSEAIIKLVCRKRRDSISKHCVSITQYNTKNKKNLSWLRSVLSTERADHLLAYLDGLSSQFNDVLFPRLCTIANHQLLHLTETIILSTIAKGQSPAYYRQIEVDCDMVRRILQLKTSDASSELSRCLYLNSLSTEQLILQYYAQLAELTETFEAEVNTPVVRLRIGYARTNNQRITIMIHVLNASNLPILDTLSQSSDPFCRLELMPRFFFPLSQFPPQTTVTHKQNLNPVWNQEFQMTTSEETFFTNGSVLCVTLLDHDLLTYNDLAGQAYILLSRIPRVDTSTKKRLAEMTLPLMLPNFQQFQGVFQILVDRSHKNALAKQVCEYERYLCDYRMLPPSANDVREVRTLKRQKSKKNY